MGDMRFDLRRLEAVKAAVRRDIDGQLYDGFAVCIAYKGKVVLRDITGFAERSKNLELTDESVFSVMSLTKPMTALAVFQAIERGALALTTRVCEVLPDFAQNGKQRVTIAHLLSHTGGMPFTLPGLNPEDEGDLDATVAAACRIAPVNRPGDVVSYSAQVSYDVLGGVVQALDAGNRRYSEIIEQDILKPLGMSDSAIGIRDDLADRRVPVVARNETDMNLRLAARDRKLHRGSQLPGGGAFSTIDDMHRFVQMLRGNGTFDGATIVSPASLALARRNHTGDKPNNTLSAQMEMRGWEPFPANLGLGFFLRGTGIFPTPFGQLASAETFGGIGAGSIVMWIDPVRDVTAVMLSAGLMDQVDSHLRFQRLSDMIHASLVAVD